MHEQIGTLTLASLLSRLAQDCINLRTKAMGLRSSVVCEVLKPVSQCWIASERFYDDRGDVMADRVCGEVSNIVKALPGPISRSSWSLSSSPIVVRSSGNGSIKSSSVTLDYFVKPTVTLFRMDWRVGGTTTACLSLPTIKITPDSPPRAKGKQTSWTHLASVTT